MAKADFLRECMSDLPQAPLDEFNRMFCVRCGNRECARAGASRLAFDRRAAGWRKDLFDEVPRAAEDDPKFASFRAKRFVVLSAGPGPSVSTQDWGRATPDPDPEPVAEEPVEEAPDTSPDATPAPPQVPQPSVQVPQPATQRQQANTPFVQGAMLPGAPAPAKAVELENSGTFTFGGEDE